MGHFFRLLGLSEIIDQEVVFVMDDTSFLSYLPKNATYKVIDQIPVDEEPDWLKNHFIPENYLIILDGYDFDAAYQKALVDYGFKLVYIDDFCKIMQEAHLVINPGLDVIPKDYKLSKRTNLALGSHYATLRKPFLDEARENKEVSVNKIKSVFISLGGADPYQLTEPIVKALLEIDQVQKLNVLIGPANNLDRSELTNNKKLEFFSALTELELLKLIKSSDAAVTASSTICYEVACARKPMAVGWYVDNQERLYKGLINHGLAYGLGWFKSKSQDELKQELKKFLRLDHRQMIKNQLNYFDGKNNIRLREVLEPLLNRIEMREATFSDAELLFEWINEPVVRSQSLNKAKVFWEEHVSWFDNKLKSVDTLHLIAELQGKPVGQIRFDKKDGYWLLSYMVAKEFRGRALGFEIVKRGLRELSKRYGHINILAQVKIENQRSQKVFDRLNFTKFTNTESEIINYKLEVKTHESI